MTRELAMPTMKALELGGGESGLSGRHISQ
jgi:hypothetical protein